MLAKQNDRKKLCLKAKTVEKRLYISSVEKKNVNLGPIFLQQFSILSKASGKIHTTIFVDVIAWNQGDFKMEPSEH